MSKDEIPLIEYFDKQGGDQKYVLLSDYVELQQRFKAMVAQIRHIIECSSGGCRCTRDEAP